jgi:phosphoglycolate phosphatase
LLKFEYLLFDLDGTLTDPKAGIINSYMNALNKLGLIEDDKECIADYLGAPLHEYFTFKHGLKNGILDKAIKLYREYYSETGLYENRLYEEIPELLEILSGKEMKLFLVTVKPAVFAKEILRHFGIDKYFLKVYGSDLKSLIRKRINWRGYSE